MYNISLGKYSLPGALIETSYIFKELNRSFDKSKILSKFFSLPFCLCQLKYSARNNLKTASVSYLNNFGTCSNLRKLYSFLKSIRD